MDIKYRKSISTVEPAEVDETSSPTVTYIRRNIKFVTPETKEDDYMPSTSYYEYEEAALTKEEYQIYLQSKESEQLRADVDYVILMGGF